MGQRIKVYGRMDACKTVTRGQEKEEEEEEG